MQYKMLETLEDYRRRFASLGEKWKFLAFVLERYEYG